MSEVQDETLMALADGALSATEADRVRALIAASPELAERFAQFVETRFLLASVRDPATAGAIDRAAAQPRKPPESVVRHAAASPARDRWGMALAASIALAIGLMGGALLDRHLQTPDEAGQVAASSSPQAREAIARALNEAPSGAIVPFGEPGASQSGRIAMVSSHRLGSGEICRQYDVAMNRYDVPTETLLSCRSDSDVWRRRVAIIREANAAFAPAAGPEDVTSLVEMLGGGSILTAVDEAAILRPR